MELIGCEATSVSGTLVLSHPAVILLGFVLSGDQVPGAPAPMPQMPGVLTLAGDALGTGNEGLPIALGVGKCVCCSCCCCGGWEATKLGTKSPCWCWSWPVGSAWKAAWDTSKPGGGGGLSQGGGGTMSRLGIIGIAALSPIGNDEGSWSSSPANMPSMDNNSFPRDTCSLGGKSTRVGFDSEASWFARAAHRHETGEDGKRESEVVMGPSISRARRGVGTALLCNNEQIARDS